MDVNRINQIFKAMNISTKDTDIKNLNEVSLFTGDANNPFNTNLLDEDKFVDSFYKSGEGNMSKQDLATLFDAIAELDGNYGMSKADLTMLAEMGNKTDANDKDGYKINEKDILAFLATVDEQIEAVKNPTVPDTKVPEKKPATPTTTTKTETVYDKPAKMEETKTETVNGNQVTTHVKYEEIKVKKEIMKEEKIYENKEVVKDVPFEKDSRIKTDKKGKYVTVEAWGSKKGANDCLERIITNSYDLDAMGIKVYNKDGSYTKEFLALEKAVMDANPNIYGDKNGKGGHKDHPDLDGTRHNKIIYTGDKIYLPKYSMKTGKTEKVLVGTKTVGTGKYEYVSTTPPSWTKTTTVTTVPLQEEPKPEPTPGPAGKDGEDGKSAYEIAVENGFKGTEEEWLASLEGKDGEDGKSAYELAVEKGFKGTEEEWLASLEGKDGKDGKSAYDIAVEAGFKGTEEEWLAALKGADGNSVERTWVGDDEHLYVQTSDGKVHDAGDVIKTDLERAIEEGLLPEDATWQDWIEFNRLTVKVADDGVAYFWQAGEWVTDASGNKIKAQGEDGKDGEDGKHVIYNPDGGKEVTPDDPTV